MKRYLMFIALLGLGFGACKKDDAAKSKEDTIIIDGEEYWLPGFFNGYE